MTIKVSIQGVTGYTGAELMRLLSRRPDVELIELVGRSAAGQPLAQTFPSLTPQGLTISDAPTLERPAEADFIFLALPHHASAETAAQLLEQAPHTRIIDLSADFRLKDVATYEKWYGPHPAPYLLSGAVYGLPELFRADYVTDTTRLVANPGCYPTCSSLALAPALKHEIIEPDVIVDAMSGLSGAGRGLKQNLHFSEADGSASAYGLDGHRHQPEIQQVLSLASTKSVDVLFTPHLVPLTRGMLATCYARFTPAFWGNYGEKTLPKPYATYTKNFTQMSHSSK
jgi:N-acetyl-gamma-glutamyl-phosphate reductase